MKINNIIFKEYALLNDDDKELYDYLIKFDANFTKPIDFFDIGKLKDFSFELIKDFQNDYNSGLNWSQLISYMAKFANVSNDKIVNTRIMYVCQFKSYIISEIELINKIELIELGHERTEVEAAAGIDMFNVFGFYSQFRELANNDITKITEIAKLKYSDCFIELLYRKRLNDFEREMNRINKNKHNG